ncbi:DUF2282 domain-containing protein [Spartinivicinus poritis]|uniref:DUF2282 domain-containing protein n=1 Tax=Spartinivicinus poritis TaxID=2994640 RepID=A0ABT5U478_9GAMM|nr:DUF2282 domain-containing protein [Spartinivicinus sp. A2-2]MDE1461171.1 DUF2282 domain-containing protein [Spartinivicinus sp. A2-2]
MKKTAALSVALGTLVALSAASNVALAGDKVKCYGVIEAGKNDCAANGHSCAGQAKVDNDPNEWKYMAKTECEKLGGSIGKPKS